MYDISIKNFNNIEVFRGQNLTEELTKVIIEKCSNLPMTIWKSPEQEDMENSDKYAKSCAEFLKNYCENKNCIRCPLFNHNKSICIIKEKYPYNWELKEGDSE